MGLHYTRSKHLLRPRDQNYELFAQLKCAYVWRHRKRVLQFPRLSIRKAGGGSIARPILEHPDVASETEHDDFSPEEAFWRRSSSAEEEAIFHVRK